MSYQVFPVIVNCQSTVAHKINAGVPQGSLLGPTLFLTCINNLSKNIVKSLLNIYADNTTVYECTHLAAAHSSDLSHTAQ